ncbi:Hypothetical protein NTJ_00803 [Nesidiocoris tenuis]|uniref:Uncharacterized protein n=1 Tax=Nesidiocoris tenuis TaxID=355587 RepID=A0ABN7ACK7_9HEMI|nr:Hypothetical protein NTJ_00803 [Nesidiocoris tenuis]
MTPSGHCPPPPADAVELIDEGNDTMPFVQQPLILTPPTTTQTYISRLATLPIPSNISPALSNCLTCMRLAWGQRTAGFQLRPAADRSYFET